jgi:carnitine O-acetyltransferase
MTQGNGVREQGRADMQNSTVTLDTALWFDDTRDSLLEPGITFANQDELPRLPIPSLAETLNKFLQFLEALQTKQQKQEAQQVVLEFIQRDGPKLQELLIAYETEGVEKGVLGSYIEEFWNDSYLVPDQTAVSNFNPFFVLEDGPDPKIAKHPIRRAASLCFAAVQLASTVREETLLPDTFKDNAICMDQFKAIFGAARVPHVSGDDLDVYPDSSHVVVMCRNQLFYFQALWPDGIVAVDEEDIVEILMAVDKNSKQADPEVSTRACPGVLTSLGRREWAKIREELSAIGSNAEYLTIIDSGLFVLVLDDMVPNSVHQAASNMLHGTYQVEQSIDPEYSGTQMGSACNRWYDKMQIIVCGDGTAGINFEHSAIDGHTALRIVSDIYAETVVNFAQSITRTVPAHGKIPHVIDAALKRAGIQGEKGMQPSVDVLPKKISLSIPECLKRKIYHAETALGDKIIASDTKVLEFMQYGKKLIVANNMSPDAFVQMSMMLAYYKVYGKVVCTYEPVLTKFFFHGRTEAMRSATIPAKQLCETFFDSTSPASTKLAALRRAVQVHTQFVRECARGKGVDRHLFALKCIAEQNDLPVPAFFKAEAWKMLNHTILSTSNCGNPSLRLFGFGPVVPDGYGIGYIIKDNSIHYSISSQRRQTERYTRALNGVLEEMAKLLRGKGIANHRTTIKTAIKSVPKAETYGDKWGQSRKTSATAMMRDKKAEKRWDIVEELSDQSPVITNSMPSSHGRRKAGRNSAPATIGSDHLMSEFKDVGPQKPQRRGSNMFSRVSRRDSLTMRQLSESGESLDLHAEEDTMVGSQV